MYRTIRKILRYDTIHTIRTLYRTIYKHLRYADTIQNVLHTIRYRTILTTMNRLIKKRKTKLLKQNFKVDDFKKLK